MNFIYHYCSINAFYLIMQNKCIRLSDLNKTNDYMEKRWSKKYIKEVLKEELNNYNINPKVYDPNANFKMTKDLYNIELINKNELKNFDIIIFAVSHNEFKNISINQLNKMFKTNVKIIIDLKWIFDEKNLLDNGFVYWRL